MQEKQIIAWVASEAGRTLINGPGQLHVATRLTSLDNLPGINQRREVQTDNVHL